MIEFTLLQWLLLFLCAMLIGLSKVGVPGVSLFVVPVLALIFGGKASTGILLPVLIMADWFGVGYYHRHAQWKYLFKLFPWSLAGIGIGLWVGEVIDDVWFKNIIAILIFICIAIFLWKDIRPGNSFFPDTWWFAASMGILGGFATMIGNVAGPIFAIYFLAMHLPKNNFIGTGALFFMITNLIKFPLHVFVWKTINLQTILLDITLFPGIAAGAFFGIWLIKKISDPSYRIFVIVITALSAFLLFI
jgi:uncharacterized protein